MQRMIVKVRALLAKAESTTFPAEAESYTAKAQELMARHSIAEAMLAEPRGPERARLVVDQPYEECKALLLAAVAEANRCRSVWSGDGFATVVGFPADLAGVEVLYASLVRQATRAMTREGRTRQQYGRPSTAAFRESFLTAFAHRIGQRLRAVTEEVSEELAAEPSLLPVLASRDRTVAETVEKLFGPLESRSMPVNDKSGWISGMAAGDRASLRRPLD